MSNSSYDIYFSGKLLPGSEPDQARQAVARIFAADQAMLERLFSGTPIRVKSAVDQETAIKYRVAFREAGALVEIRPCTATAPRATPEASRPATMTLLPPMTGSLAEYAPRITPARIPNNSALQLAPVGAPIDLEPSPPPVDIDTTELTLAPPNSGSLEDCQTPKRAQPLPDISSLKLAR